MRRLAQLRVVQLETRATPSAAPIQLADTRPGPLHGEPSLFTAAGNLMYFKTVGSQTGLWRTDGTPGGTGEVMDTGGSPSFDSPLGITAIGNRVFFAATGNGAGYELWKVENAASGASLIQDINSGSTSSNPSFLNAVGSEVYFSRPQQPSVTNFGRATARPAAPPACSISRPGRTVPPSIR